MEVFVMVLHVISALGIIGLVLLQHGKGADMGAAFGGGSSGSLFGSSGSANFLSRCTSVLATFFFLTSLGLTWFSSHRGEHKGLMANPPTSSVPAAPLASPETVPAPSSNKGVDTDSKVKEIPK
jgi:preprotein translocase subunit SecG